MKRNFALAGLLLFSSLLFFRCRKILAVSRTNCDVQMFVSEAAGTFSNDTARSIPYLFSKTYDSYGHVNTIDAYLKSIAPGYHYNFKLLYAGNMLYCLNASRLTDTLIVVWLNGSGRPIKMHGIQTSGNSTTGETYEFTYDSQNKLHSLNWRTRTDSCLYDVNGNVLAFGENLYVYDYTRTATQQFYFDLENYSADFYSVKVLMYLNYFPELTSPVNLRIKGVAPFVLTYYQFNHQVDSNGKLISYDYSTAPAPGDYVVHTKIIWNCPAPGQ